MALILKSPQVRYILLSCAFLIALFFPSDSIGLSGLAEPLNSLIFIPILLIPLIYYRDFAKQVNLYDQSLNLLTGIVLLFSVILLVIFDVQLTNRLVINLLVIAFIIYIIQVLYIANLNPERILSLLQVFLFIQLTVGLYQYLEPIVTNAPLTNAFRPVGSFRQVNIYASALVIGFGISLYLNSSLVKFKNLTRLYFLLFPVLLFLTGSKAGYVSLIGMLVTLIVLQKEFFKKNREVIYLSIIGCIFIFILLNSDLPHRSVSDLTNTSVRQLIYSHSLVMIKEFPLFGWGAGSFTPSFYFSLIESGQALPNNVFILHPHNEILLWAIELGLVGIMFLIVTFTVLLRNIIRYKEETGSTWGFIILMPPLIHSMVEFPLHASGLYLLICILIYYCFTKKKQIKHEGDENRSLTIFTRITSINLLVVVGIISFSAYHATQYTKAGSIQKLSEHRELIVWPFVAEEYITQTDIKIEIALAKFSKNQVALSASNAKLLSVIKLFPLEELATTFLKNCVTLNNCNETDINFVEFNFPNAKNKVK